jgi:hypothetical protein
LKLKNDTLLSSVAFKFKLRRYTTSDDRDQMKRIGIAAGAYTRPLFGST